MTLMVYSGAWGKLSHGKSRDTVPLRLRISTKKSHIMNLLQAPGGGKAAELPGVDHL
jgi:hypothetical protein